MPPFIHGVQNYAPLWHPLYLSWRAGDDGSLADSAIKHYQWELSKYLDQR